MPTKLSDIAITHISLVKKGANGKQIIYKSANSSNYDRDISIKKSDSEKGVVYGIVYSPGEVDSQGDFAEADEIEKAAYGFMKSLNARNVDIEHSFVSEDAFVAESWITKANDSIFPEEPEGSWAVAIKLESDELRQLAKSGELTGLSMAGEARKEEVAKATGDNEKPFKKFMNALADAVGEIWIDFGGRIQKSENIGESMSKEFADIVKSKLQKATEEVGATLEKANKDVTKLETKVDSLTTKVTELKDKNKELITDNAALKKENKELKEELEKVKDSIKETDEKVEEVAKASKQTTVVKKEEKNENNKTKGVL